jgi:hypothetical protein
MDSPRLLTFSRAATAATAPIQTRLIAPRRQQDRDQRPATPEAVGAVFESRLQGSEATSRGPLPVMHDQKERRAATSQTDPLQRGQLVHPGSKKYHCPHADRQLSRTRAHHLQAPHGRVSQDSRARPDEDVGQGHGCGAASTRPARAHQPAHTHGERHNAGQHHGGHHHHPDEQEQSGFDQPRVHRVTHRLRSGQDSGLHVRGGQQPRKQPANRCEGQKQPREQEFRL